MSNVTYPVTMSNSTNATNSTNMTDSDNSTTSDNVLDYCDYYLMGEGYQFTQASMSIGLVVIENRFNQTLDLYYKNGGDNATTTNDTAVSMPSSLAWNWSELTSLIEALIGNSQCSSSSSSNATSSNGTSSSSSTPSQVSILAGLGINWSQWQQLAQGNLNVSDWGKDELKVWIQNYVVYWNALQNLVRVSKATVSGAVNSIEAVVGTLLGNYEN